MPPFLARLLMVCAFSFASTASLRAQGSAAPAPATPVPKLDYPDSTIGLEHLAKDILKAQSQNDGGRAEALIKNLVLPNAYDWYDQTFGREAAVHAGRYYDQAAASVPPFLARIFVDSARQNFSRVQALRYERTCDDDAGPETYGILLRRLEAVPLYEIRLLNGQQLLRIFPVAYVDGGFRFLIAPDFRPSKPAGDAENPEANKSSSQPGDSPPSPRVRLDGSVQAGKLVKRVKPIYPEKARHEHVSGTVKIHAVIGKDGQVTRIFGVNGICSLAESAVNAVRQWRYSPTLKNGEPVEVDTEIDVVFALNP